MCGADNEAVGFCSSGVHVFVVSMELTDSMWYAGAGKAPRSRRFGQSIVCNTSIGCLVLVGWGYICSVCHLETGGKVLGMCGMGVVWQAVGMLPLAAYRGFGTVFFAVPFGAAIIFIGYLCSGKGFCVALFASVKSEFKDGAVREAMLILAFSIGPKECLFGASS